MLFDAHADTIERARVLSKAHAYELSALVWLAFAGNAPAYDDYVHAGRPRPRMGGIKEAVAGFRTWMKAHGSQ